MSEKEKEKLRMEKLKSLTVVMLHGNFSASKSMEPIMHELSTSARVIAPTLRGFGLSSYNKPLTSYKDLA